MKILSNSSHIPFVTNPEDFYKVLKKLHMKKINKHISEKYINSAIVQKEIIDRLIERDYPL